MATPIYDFDEIIDREGTNSVKYDAAGLFNPLLPDNFIPLWVADMDFACAPPILEAMKRRIDRRILGYSMLLDQSYRDAVVSWQKRRNDWEIRPNWIHFTAGVVKAVNISVKLFTNEGDAILVHTPAYHPFEMAVNKHKRKLILSKLKSNEQTGYTEIDFDDFEEKIIKNNVKMFILCNPHNPTGRVWKENELRRMLDFCFKHNVFVVSDEIHSDLLRLNQKHLSAGKLYPNEKQLIVCTAPSKTFNLAGNQLSNIIIQNEEIRKVWNSGPFRGGFPNPLSIEACKAAYNECEGWLDQLRKYLDDNFALLDKRIKTELADKATFYPSEGTYLAWVDLTKSGIEDKELKTRISQAGILIEFADDFVADGEKHVRINISCPRSVLNKAIDILVAVLKNNYIDPQFEGRLKVGDKIPDFEYTSVNTVTNQVANNNKFHEILQSSQKAALIFLRYIGCPVCSLDLINLKKNYEKLQKDTNNAKIYVVLMSSTEKMIAGHYEFPFDIICDPERKLYDIFKVGIAKDIKALIDGMTMEKLAKASEEGIVHGENEGIELQRPATFIVDTKSLQITHVHYGKGAADTLSVDQLIEQLK